MLRALLVSILALFSFPVRSLIERDVPHLNYVALLCSQVPDTSHPGLKFAGRLSKKDQMDFRQDIARGGTAALHVVMLEWRVSGVARGKCNAEMSLGSMSLANIVDFPN